MVATSHAHIFVHCENTWLVEHKKKYNVKLN